MTSNQLCNVIELYSSSLLYPNGKVFSIDQLFAAVYDTMLVLNTDARLAAIVASWLFIFGTFNFLFPNMVKRFSWRKVRTTIGTVLRILGPLVLFYYVWIPLNRLLYWILSQKKVFNIPISCHWLPFFSLMVGLAWFAVSCNYLADTRRRRRSWYSLIVKKIGSYAKRWYPTRWPFFGRKASPEMNYIEDDDDDEGYYESMEESPRRTKHRVKRHGRHKERESERERMKRRYRRVNKLGIPEEAFHRPPRDTSPPRGRSPRSKSGRRVRINNNNSEDCESDDDILYKSGRKMIYGNKKPEKAPPKTTRTGKVYGY